MDASGNSNAYGKHHCLQTIALWALRLGFTIVFAWNVLCAFQFVFAPADFIGGYQLSGPEGIAALQGLGIAFLMWNATYPAFIVAPRRFWILGIIILVQQVIGLIGETFVLWTLDPGYGVLADSIQRFIAFDSAGLAIMAATGAFYLYASKAQAR